VGAKLMDYFLILEKVHENRICPFTICHPVYLKELSQQFYVVIQLFS
jgi:hypothetical protein